MYVCAVAARAGLTLEVPKNSVVPRTMASSATTMRSKTTGLVNRCNVFLSVVVCIAYTCRRCHANKNMTKTKAPQITEMRHHLHSNIHEIGGQYQQKIGTRHQSRDRSIQLLPVVQAKGSGYMRRSSFPSFYLVSLSLKDYRYSYPRL